MSTKQFTENVVQNMVSFVERMRDKEKDHLAYLIGERDKLKKCIFWKMHLAPTIELVNVNKMIARSERNVAYYERKISEYKEYIKSTCHETNAV